MASLKAEEERRKLAANLLHVLHALEGQVIGMRSEVNAMRASVVGLQLEIVDQRLVLESLVRYHQAKLGLEEVSEEVARLTGPGVTPILPRNLQPGRAKESGTPQ